MNSAGDGAPARLPPPPFWRTPYFEIARRRPDRALLTDDAILAVLAKPARVVTLEDGETVHNAFLDRSFVP